MKPITRRYSTKFTSDSTRNPFAEPYKTREAWIKAEFEVYKKHMIIYSRDMKMFAIIDKKFEIKFTAIKLENCIKWIDACWWEK